MKNAAIYDTRRGEAMLLWDGSDFASSWEGAADIVRQIAEILLQDPKAKIARDSWQRVLWPYALPAILFFKPLMDRLDLPEEERFLAACDNLDQSWQQFFSTILVRHPGAASLIARLERARHDAHDAVRSMFTGEVAAILTPSWANGYEMLENGYGPLQEALTK